jgi:hypothetical protein
MASKPGKRSPRKSTASAARAGKSGAASSGAPRQPPLVDPEAVAAVRRTTAKTVRALVTATRRGSRALGRATIISANWLWPRLSRLAATVGRGVWRGLSAASRWAWIQRKALTRVAHRGLWWGALAILVLVGRALLAADGDPELVEVAVLWFVAGLSMSVLVLLGAPEKRMRVAAFALASGHGSLAALAWVVGIGV